MHETRWSLIFAHRERLLVIARRRCRTREDAEDIVQEAMLRCATFANLDESRIGQFLTSTTMRLCVDMHRTAERTSRLAERLAANEPEPIGPEEAACRAAERRRLVGVFATLPHRHRSMVLAKAHGKSVTQIAHEHDVTYRAAESALGRARTALRAALTASLALVAACSRRLRTVAVAAVPVVAVVLAGTAWLPGLGGGDGGSPGAAGLLPGERQTARVVRDVLLDATSRSSRRPAGAAVAASRAGARRPGPGGPPGHVVDVRPVPGHDEIGVTVVSEYPPDDPRGIEDDLNDVRECAEGRNVKLWAEVSVPYPKFDASCGR